MKQIVPKCVVFLKGHLLMLQLTVVLICCVWDGNYAWAAEKNISCFVYHRFGDARYPSTNIDLDTFQNHLQYLKDNEIEVVTLGEAVELIRGDKELTKKTVVLTIDDGYESFLNNGMPLLRQYGFRATLFVSTATVGNSGFINWQELKELREEGIEIGNHSHSHAYFVDVEQVIRAETFRAVLEKSQQVFLDELGYVPSLFSYPYGEYTDAMASQVKAKGFVAAAAQNSGTISKYSNLFALPRFPMASVYAKLESFIGKTSMHALPGTTLDKSGHLVLQENPPLLRIQLQQPEKLQTKHIQCFVAGTRECSWEYDQEQGIITMRSIKPLQARRTLYTLTIPSISESGVWHWYSHLWINTQSREY